MQLCSGTLSYAPLFISDHALVRWCDRKRSQKHLESARLKVKLFNKKHHKSATAGSVMPMWFQDIPTASYWSKSSSQVIRPPVIKKNSCCWHVDRVFWCILGLVSFPKVCKKSPSYNNFQRKTTHQTTWALERFGAAAVAQRGSPGNEGKFPTQHIRGTWMHWGYNSQWRFSSLWNRKWVKCVASVFLEPAEGDDNVWMSLPATPWLVVHLFYHGNRVTLPRPRFLQGNRRKWQNLWGVVLGSISWGEVAPSCHIPPHHPPSCPLQRDGRWDSDPSSRYPLPKVSCDLTFWETQWKQATQPQIHQAPHTKNGRMFMNHHWFRKLLHENQMKSEIPSVVAGADIYSIGLSFREIPNFFQLVIQPR